MIPCGFASDPLAGEEAPSLGSLTVPQARMSPDLAMSDELLNMIDRRGLRDHR